MKNSTAYKMSRRPITGNKLLFVSAYPQSIKMFLTPEEWVQNVHSVSPAGVPCRGTELAEKYRQFLSTHKGQIPFAYAAHLPSWTWDIAAKMVSDTPGSKPYGGKKEDFYLFITAGVEPEYYRFA